MKSIKSITTFILSIILTICLIAIGFITIVSSTILDKNYTVSKLEETNFYHETYQLVISNFENYIYQSGLEETILEDICTESKVKQDINTILSNIYEGTNQEIETKSIEDNLNHKIDSLQVKSSITESAIHQFVKQICDEYKNTLIHTSHENEIHEIYVKVMKFIEKAQFAVIIVACLDVILLFLLNRKEVLKFIRSLGIALLANGLFEIIVCHIINSKVNIQGIKVVNEAFSTTMVTIIQEVMGKIQNLGIIAIIVAIVFIMLYAIIETKDTEKM